MELISVSSDSYLPYNLRGGRCLMLILFRSSDWEYPGYAEHSGTPDDIVSYPLLMEELRRALDELEEETGKHYG